MKIAVLTHNPKGKWGDVRPQIEQGFYEKWGKCGISLKLGQQVLIYISKGFNKIKYIMEVSNVYDDNVDLKLIQELDEKKSELLSFKKLKENGLKVGTMNYILNNNKSLFKYVHSVLNNIIKKEKKIMITKNIILYGAPGVGKTHNYQRVISMIENGDNEKEIFDTITNNKSSSHVELNNDDIFQTIKDEKRVEFVTFHQSYSYEDFIEGFRPSENNIKLEDGIFKKLCDDASKSKENFYLVIDEINRGNISKIFGELITLIEEDKRDEYEVTLPYSKEPFKIPSNLYIIATMNSTDKSIATIDIALRRRFTFLKMRPNLELVENDEARELMEKLNKYIGENLGEDYMLGHSYFMGKNINLEFIKKYKIKPLLEEYFYADEEKLKEILNLHM
ncbi:MAG: AAA family ATPase [Sulfurospirillum sp.]|nr:AAA family ATPase [Sulfurospirillum sp.]